MLHASGQQYAVRQLRRPVGPSGIQRGVAGSVPASKRIPTRMPRRPIIIGGLVAFGILGIFIGPTVLAVAYTLLNAWMAESDDREPPAKTP